MSACNVVLVTKYPVPIHLFSAASMKPLAIIPPLTSITLALAARKNLIIDTDLFSDVDDAGALLIVATSPDVNLLAVNINSPFSYSALAASAILAHYGKGHVPIGIPAPPDECHLFRRLVFCAGRVRHDAHSPLPRRDLLTRMLAEVVVMSGSYPSSSSSSSSSVANVSGLRR
ncbi:hypothetical protein VTG60DRAFT_2094 [Thermothelomyces hinnuleus]